MKTQTISDLNDLIEGLCKNAIIDGLPDKAFFKSFTSRRRREIVYKVQSATEGLAIELEVHGSGNMKASVTMPCISIEDGLVIINEDSHKLSWVHNGEEVIVKTRLDHKHLENYPCAKDIMKAFIDAINTQKRAFCPGGFDQWKAMTQLMASRIASELKTKIEIIATLPLPSVHTGALCRGVTDVEINDISDPDNPSKIIGYEHEFHELDDKMMPEAMTLMLLPPGYLVCRRHKEIFTAG